MPISCPKLPYNSSPIKSLHIKLQFKGNAISKYAKRKFNYVMGIIVVNIKKSLKKPVAQVVDWYLDMFAELVLWIASVSSPLEATYSVQIRDKGRFKKEE